MQHAITRKVWLAVAVAGTTAAAAALIIPRQQHSILTSPLSRRKRSGRSLRFAATTTTTTCQADADNPKLQVDVSQQQSLGASDQWHRLPQPSRAQVATHAIYGQLWGPQGIVSYQVYRHSNVTGATTRGPVVMAHVQLGHHVDGHAGIVHGGILCLIVDDVLGYACEALRVPMGVTANLNVNFRAPVSSGSAIVVHVVLTERTKRKLVYNVTVTEEDGTTLYGDASSVFVIPRDVYENSMQRDSAG